jgi:hypothetical protein
VRAPRAGGSSITDMTTRRPLNFFLTTSLPCCFLRPTKRKEKDKMTTKVTFGEKDKVVVVGTGDKAHGLAKMYELHAKKDEHFKIVFTELIPTTWIDPFVLRLYIHVENFSECLANADVVIIVIPSYAMEPFLIQNPGAAIHGQLACLQ